MVRDIRLEDLWSRVSITSSAEFDNESHVFAVGLIGSSIYCCSVVPKSWKQCIFCIDSCRLGVKTLSALKCTSTMIYKRDGVFEVRGLGLH